MPFKRIDYRDLDMYYVLNPDPQEFISATHDRLPESRPFKEGLPVLVFIHAGEISFPAVDALAGLSAHNFAWPSAGANVMAWRAQLGDPRLNSQFNLFAMDARFHGWTRGGPRTEHTLENSAECIVATLVRTRTPRPP